MWLLTLLKLCFLRANPQDLPTSSGATAVAILTYCITDVVTALMTVPLVRALEAAVIDTFLLVALVHMALNLRKLNARLRQTLLALAASGTVLAVVTLAVAGLLPSGTSLDFVWTLSVLWMFVVYGHILRHALDVSYVLGIVATAVYFMLSLLVAAPLLMVSETS